MEKVIALIMHWNVHAIAEDAAQLPRTLSATRHRRRMFAFWGAWMVVHFKR